MAISQVQKQRLVSLYQDGNSIAVISSVEKISATTISRILKAAGVEIRLTNYQKLHIDKDQVNILYDAGQSTYQIATQFGCSDETIRHMIKTMRDKSTRNKLSDNSKAKIAIASKRNWQDPEYVAKVETGTKTEEYKDKLRAAGKINYATSLGKFITSIESKLIMSQKAKALWADPEYRAKQQIWFAQRGATLTKASLIALSDPEKRRQWLLRQRRAHANTRANSGGWISSSQRQLYYILSASQITYFEEGPDTQIGPFYVVDCVIPQQQQMIKPLIVEVQGEYWHALPHVMLKDRQKSTYIRKHTNYDLLPLEELHLNSFAEVENKLSGYGLTLFKQDFCVADLEIKPICEADAATFYSIFHYSGTVRKGAMTFGAFYANELVAAISYCYPLRTETATKLGYTLKNVVEISRLARRTNIICKNLASYFIGQTRKLLPLDIKCVVSFSDTTYGHTGHVYKAAGFIQDGVVAKDYCYISINGRYHKKTIWDRAKRMRMTELDYAEKHNLLKIMGDEKTRWVYKLR
jgi:transposase